nr:enoyl-coa delta isomerase 1, peroxisomal [Quercus suber]
MLIEVNLLGQDYLCNKCKRPGHFARDCPNVTVCNNCGLPGHIAAECNSTTMCWNCKEPGHLASQCPNDPVCHMCGKIGHLARDCTNPGLPAHDARLCNNCYKQGHIAADCTNEKACNNCRKTGHLARDCPNEPVCNICNISGHLARQCHKSTLASEIGGPFRDIVCHNCGHPGHISRDCVSIVICTNCGGRGHQSFECPSGRMFDRGLRRLNPTLIDAIQSALHRVRAESASSSALITTAQGKFFSNGYDLAWAGASKARRELMNSKLQSLVTDLISLPIPTIAAISGHASAAGFILALGHDYILMRSDRGFLYMSELDIKLVIPPWFIALVECKIGSPKARRAVVLTAAKITAKQAVELGIIDSAHDSADETVDSAVRLGEELAKREWDGHVYGQNRMRLFAKALDEIALDTTESTQTQTQTRSRM